MAAGESNKGAHGGLVRTAEEGGAVSTVESCHGLPEIVNRPTIVALGLVGSADGLIHHRVQDNVPASRGEPESTLAGGDGLIIRAHQVELVCEKARDPSEPTRVVASYRERLGLGPARSQAHQLTKRSERRAENELEIYGLLAYVTLLRQMRKGAEHLFEIPHSLAVGRLHQDLLPRLPAVHQG